jgi:hypothetical protein
MGKMNLAHDLGYTLHNLNNAMYPGELVYWFAWSKITEKKLNDMKEAQ